MLRRLTALAIVAAVGMSVPVMAQGTATGQPKAGSPSQQPKKDPKAAEAATLNVGDKAPAVTVSEWIKGDKVEKFEAGKVYVVEFWATWCGPCKESIPHLTQLQKEYKDVKFVGVSVWESDQSKIKPFVNNDMKDKMAYTVAADDVPTFPDSIKAGTKEAKRFAIENGKMSKNWMTAAGQHGIPTAFIVGKDGKIAWIGHPVQLEDPLKKAIAANSKAEAPATEPHFITVSQEGQPEKQPAAKDSKGDQDKAKSDKKANADDMPKLVLGDKAPAMTVEEWVKGEPVTGFEKGKIYVVEFWATWCGPCKISIPHLTELQKQYKNVKFIGVSVWETDQADVKPFVKDEGDKMDYTVAIDSVPAMPEGTTGRKAKSWSVENGKMSKSWMKAAGQNGIPTAFVINGEGKVAWIGHPMEMEEPLKSITDGTWDIAAEAAKAKKAADNQGKLQQLTSDFQEAMASGDSDKIVKAIDALNEAEPKSIAPLAGTKFKALGDKDNEKAYTWARTAVDGPLKDNAQALNAIAWTIVDPEDSTFKKKDLDLALRAGMRADELAKHKDPAIIDTLAKVYHDKGDLGKAIELQEKAVKLIGDAPEAEKNSMEDDLKARLEQYQAEQKKRQG